MNVKGEDDELDGSSGDGETSLRDDLATALRTIRERDESDDSGQHLSATDGAAGGDGEGQEAKPPRTDGRDDRGRFAGNKGGEEEAAAALAGDDGAKPTGQEGAAGELTNEADQVPKSWRQDEAAEWANLSPKARQAVLRREREIATLTGRQDGERQFGREVADIFRPYADEITQAGATPQLALQTLLNNHKALRSQNPEEKVATARRLLHEYGIDPRLLAQPDPRMPQDPHVLSLMREVEALRGQVSSRSQGGQQNYAPLPPAQEDDSFSSDIEAFKADPAHPHFDHVAGTMASLIESGAAPDLETAYQMAVAGNPSLRSTSPVTPQPAPEAQRSQEKVAAARRAGVSVQGSPGQTSAARPTSLREELRQNLRQLGFGS